MNQLLLFTNDRCRKSPETTAQPRKHLVTRDGLNFSALDLAELYAATQGGLRIHDLSGFIVGQEVARDEADGVATEDPEDQAGAAPASCLFVHERTAIRHYVTARDGIANFVNLLDYTIASPRYSRCDFASN
jgi:hypothetical protein